MDARVGPLSFPVIEVGLRLCQALKAQALQRCVLGVPDAALDFPLGEKRALQIVLMVAHKFSPLRIRSTH
jgi:hypothetical protein